MNGSRKSCDDCGRCCRNLFIQPNFTITEDLKRWIELHGLIVMDKYIRIDTPCSKLEGNRCSDYDNRPQICKDYFCEYGDQNILRYMFKGDN